MNPRIEVPIIDLALAASREAALKAIARARQTGTSIVIFEDGAIKKISPDEALARLESSLPTIVTDDAQFKT